MIQPFYLSIYLLNNLRRTSTRIALTIRYRTDCRGKKKWQSEWRHHVLLMGVRREISDITRRILLCLIILVIESKTKIPLYDLGQQSGVTWFMYLEKERRKERERQRYVCVNVWEYIHTCGSSRLLLILPRPFSKSCTRRRHVFPPSRQEPVHPPSTRHVADDPEIKGINPDLSCTLKHMQLDTWSAYSFTCSLIDQFVYSCDSDIIIIAIYLRILFTSLEKIVIEKRLNTVDTIFGEQERLYTVPSGHAE